MVPLKPIYQEDRYLHSSSGLRRLLAIANHARERVVCALEETGQLGNRLGGGSFMAAFENGEGHEKGESVGPELMGPIHEVKIPIYIRCSVEKLVRIAYQRVGRSFDTVNEKMWQYGGAVRLLGYNVSFSGLPPEADEAICVLAIIWSFGLEKRFIDSIRACNSIFRLIPVDELVERPDLWPAEKSV